MTKRKELERSIRKVKATNPAWAARMEAELVVVEPPRAVIHLLALFGKLNEKRTYQVVSAMAGAVSIAEPICPLKQEAILRAHGKQITPWEAETIDQMDAAFLEESAKLRG